jgi:hypothetical protein
MLFVGATMPLGRMNLFVNVIPTVTTKRSSYYERVGIQLRYAGSRRTTRT